MASPQNSSHSSDSNSSQSSDSNSNSKAIALPTPTDASRVRTIPKTFKSSKRKAGVKRKHGEAAAAGPSNAGDDENEEAKEEKPAGRSWVWLHFKKIEKPQFEIKDEHAREEGASTIDQPEKPSTSKSSKASKNSRVGNAGKSKAAK